MIEPTTPATMNLTTSDSLTGVSNRRGFVEIGQHLIALATRLKQNVDLLYLDVEAFDAFNQRHGREEGDRLLVELAQLLLSTFRGGDLVGRIGNDEFAVLLTGTNDAIRQQVLRRLESGLDRMTMMRPLESRLVVKHSVVAYDPARYASLEELITAAGQRQSV
jgi:diguanylate cyclase (GGDEF)-like protein